MSTEPEPKPASEQDESRLSSDSDSSDSEVDSKQPTEWLATTRKKRATAGNRMKSMLANEEPDSDMELLFAEDEDDQGFTDVGEDASDVHMDSSSDDEDENNTAADDLEGEKELERQAKERRAAQRKRKAQEAIPAKFRKKVRIDPTTPAAPAAKPAPRPKKKSERASWLPSPADMPTRASSRQTTRLSKEQLHAQMEEREARRLKQLEHMQKKAARLEALKKPPMTQEERLREAAIVEKRNSKSLNRWEEAEKQREEERRAKLAALNTRTLKGPVITFWSGTRAWKDGGASRYVVMEEKPKRKERKPKDKDKDKAKDKDKDQGQDKDKEKDKATAPANGEKMEEKESKEAGTPSGEAAAATAQPQEQPSETKPQEPEQKSADMSGSTEEPSQPTKTSQAATSQPESESIPDSAQKQAEGAPVMAMPPMPPPASGLAAPTPPPDSSTGPTAPPGQSEPKPSGVLAAPVLAPPLGVDVERSSPPILSAPEPPKSNVLAPPNTSQSPQPPPATTAIKPETTTDPTSQETRLLPAQDGAASAEKIASATPSEVPEPSAPVDTTATRNAIVYQNFDENAIKDKTIQTQILFGRKMNKIAKPAPAPLCVITNHPARYRDPATGLPFYNTYAYREIQRLRKGEYRWSKILGAWTGSGTYAAKGVPERFLKPSAAGEKKGKEKEKEVEAPKEPDSEQKPPEDEKVEGTQLDEIAV